MNRLRSSSLLLMLILSITAFASQAAPAQEGAQPIVGKMELAEGDCIVFLGDSITHQCLYTQYVEDYFYTRYPNMRLQFHNAGVGGAQALDALDRFDRDVAAYNPKYVTILLGMNDGHYVPFNQPTMNLYHNGMTELLNRLDAIGATPILMTPTMYDSRAARISRPDSPEQRLEFYNSVLAYFGRWLQEQALNNGYGFVDMFTPLNDITLDQRKTDPDFTMIKDAVHPGPSGQLVMAVAILEDMQVDRLVSSINVEIDNKGTVHASMKNGELSGIKLLDDGLEFTAHAESLPLVIPEEAAEGVALTKLGHKFSRESLEIHGLESSKYKLLIDDQEIGTYTSTQLERHLELQGNANTPQYQQAAEVAAINKERNDGPVHELRAIWSLFQRYSRHLRELAANPESKEAKDLVSKAEVQLGDLEKRVADAEAKAKALEDKIFEINKPQPHVYRLIKVD
ncbi:GDSL-like Lipase/Acylhydrolase [Polystyrenella longa]|uniref:GDSL-like Lipase/Acylhydrolase n=1 Tax=Polystyrenella longa TaxID=2528007 RepID=A0A518CQW2_9PLAN|nr:SGNH/GDSL hydrolase family protein [Polystyrenella longa]QDU81608.1 GDSL-like Lipase/Acylhydrolase [Polystyrenella longa]